MELGEFKPLLTALALPPAAPLLLAFIGLLLVWRKKALGHVLCVVALGGMWLLACNAVAVWLALHILPQVFALPPATAGAMLQARQVQAVVVLGGGAKVFPHAMAIG